MVRVSRVGMAHHNPEPQALACANSRVRKYAAQFVAATFALAVAGNAAGQEDQAAKEFRAVVVDLSGSIEPITVPLYGSVTVETTIEVTRADVIANTIADIQVISPTRMLITGQGYGSTNVVLMGADNKQYVFEVSVELDLRRLNDAILELDPLSHAQAQSVLGNIVLTGTASSAERATRMVELATLFLPAEGSGGRTPVVQNHLEVAGEQQVLLRVVVAEVSRAAVRELGINGFLAGDNFKDAFVINQIGRINPIDIGAAADALVTRNLPFVTGEAGIPLGPVPTLSLGFPRVQLQVFIKALADNSLLKILAEPNLVAISGETASFLAGGEFPIPVPQGFQVVTIEYREFGVRLNFTPVVRGYQRIRLRVAPEVSELDFTNAVQFEGFVIPGRTARATETTVELGNGETIAIAGLLSEQVRAFVTRVPGLGDVPILGALFRSVSFRRSLTELVILVTAEIVAPLDVHQKIALPTDRVRDPSDFELYALGLLEGANETSMSATDPPRGGPVASLADSANKDGGLGLDLPAAVSHPDDLAIHGPWGYARPTGDR